MTDTYFEFDLTPEQIEAVEPALKQARDVYNTGFMGAIICGVRRFDGTGQVQCYGDFVRRDKALKIKDILISD